MTFAKIDRIGTSTESFEAAVDDAIESADRPEDRLMWVEVDGFGVEVASVETREYQADVTLAFEE